MKPHVTYTCRHMQGGLMRAAEAVLGVDHRLQCGGLRGVPCLERLGHSSRAGLHRLPHVPRAPPAVLVNSLSMYIENGARKTPLCQMGEV